MSLVITTHTGDTISLNCVAVADPRLTQAPSRFSGLETDNQVVFYFEVALRARLPELLAHAGQNVVQTRNRAGKIQLLSAVPCSFVKFRWDASRAYQPNFGWNPANSYAEMMGVFFITSATLGGFEETTTLTLYRGDWLLQDGQPINFETGGGSA